MHEAILTPQKPEDEKVLKNIGMQRGEKRKNVEMRGGVTDAGQRTNEQTNTEDRTTQPMEAGG